MEDDAYVDQWTQQLTRKLAPLLQKLPPCDENLSQGKQGNAILDDKRAADYGE